MNYCSHCGSDQLVFRIPEGDNFPRLVCGNCGTIHYSNPKIVTGCLSIWEDKVLLCKRAIEPRVGYWNVPSGYLENKESVEEGAKRELWEEARAQVDLLGVHSIYSLPHIDQVYVHFLGRLTELTFEPGEESLETALFTETEIPWSEIAFTSSEFSLKRYFADVQHGQHKTHWGQLILPKPQE